MDGQQRKIRQDEFDVYTRRRDERIRSDHNQR